MAPRRGWWGLVLAILAIANSACALAPGALDGPTRLNVFAAASLRDALDSVVDAYADVAPDMTIIVSTDSSATLRTQIEQGAPADVFLSADLSHPQTLADAGLTDGAVVTFARNELAVIVPSTNPAGIRTPADLATPGVAIVAAGGGVPISAYAAELVANLGAIDGYPADFEAAYEANVVSREDNVAAVVAKIELGEGDAAIVYATDARSAESVMTIEIPDGANVDADYGGVVIRESDARAASTAFLEWLAGPAGQGVLAEHGFAALE